MNVMKLVLFNGIPAACLAAIGIWGGGSAELLFFGFLIWAVIAFGLYWFSDKIVIKLCGAEQLTVYHSPSLFRAVEEVAGQARVPVPAIYMIPDAGANVCAIGRNSGKGGLIFTEGVTKALSSPELRCAIAHGLSHIHTRDVDIGALAAICAALFGLGGSTATERAASGESAGERQERLTGLFSEGLLKLLAVKAAFVVQILVNKKREYHADAFAARLTGRPLDMANAVRTLEKKRFITPLKVPPAVAHLFLVNPIRSLRLARTFNTHPSMEDRIQRLEHMNRSMAA